MNKKFHPVEVEKLKKGETNDKRRTTKEALIQKQKRFQKIGTQDKRSNIKRSIKATEAQRLEDYSKNDKGRRIGELIKERRKPQIKRLIKRRTSKELQH